LLIVGWMMHLIRVAMRMILGNCEVLVLLLLVRMERRHEILQILRFFRVPASRLLPLLVLLSTHLFLLLTMQFLRVAVSLREMPDRRGRGLMRMRRVLMRLSGVTLGPIELIESLHLDLCHCRVP